MEAILGSPYCAKLPYIVVSIFSSTIPILYPLITPVVLNLKGPALTLLEALTSLPTWRTGGCSDKII